MLLRLFFFFFPYSTFLLSDYLNSDTKKIIKTKVHLIMLALIFNFLNYLKYNYAINSDINIPSINFVVSGIFILALTFIFLFNYRKKNVINYCILTMLAYNMSEFILLKTIFVINDYSYTIIFGLLLISLLLIFFVLSIIFFAKSINNIRLKY
jgi:hypothetical protein